MSPSCKAVTPVYLLIRRLNEISHLQQSLLLLLLLSEEKSLNRKFTEKLCLLGFMFFLGQNCYSFFFFDILIPSTKVNMLILKQQQKSDAR